MKSTSVKAIHGLLKKPLLDSSGKQLAPAGANCLVIASTTRKWGEELTIAFRSKDGDFVPFELPASDVELLDVPEELAKALEKRREAKVEEMTRSDGLARTAVIAPNDDYFARGMALVPSHERRGLLRTPYPFQPDEPEWELIQRNAPAKCNIFLGISITDVVYYFKSQTLVLGSISVSKDPWLEEAWLAVKPFHRRMM